MLTNTAENIQTLDGTYIELVNPDPEDMNIQDVAHRLALKNRWGGITNDLTPQRNPVPYYVAQHSCHVHDVVALRLPEMMPDAVFDDRSGPEFYALMHDAPEAYLDDVATPIKPLLHNYKELEESLMQKMLARWDVPYNGFIHEAVRRIDYAILFWERDALVGQPVTPWLNEKQHPGGTIFDFIPDFEPWSAKRAKQEFLNRFTLLNR